MLSLALVAGWLYSNFVDDYKDNLIDVMQSKMTLLASASSSALLFHDNEAGQEVLSSLELLPGTRFAQIFDSKDNLFAEFKRPDETIDITLEELSSGTFFQKKNIYLAQRIYLDGEDLGSILISASTDSLQAQQSRYATTVIVVFLISSILAYFLNWRMQKVLTAPLRQLVSLIGNVAQKREYRKRLDVKKGDEIGILSQGVNSMLDTIEEREQQLEENSQRLENLVQELFDRAHYDALTKLPNRHLLTDRLSHSIEMADRGKTSSALLFLDLDRFKVINDSLGHPLGDRVLIDVARKLEQVVRKADSVCRWGGDEFVVLLEHIEHEADIHSVAKKIITALSVPIVIQGHQLHVSTCIGIATYPDDGEDTVTLLKHADISMYKAKERGPGHYCFFNRDMLADSVARLSMETRVRKALEQEELYLVYQPQVYIEDQRLGGMEALVRWNDNGVNITPDEFIPVIEELGLMHQFSIWVLREACRQNRQWQSAELPMARVAVNLPVSFIMHPRCVESIASILQETGLDASFLEIEITENTFMSSASYAVDVLRSLTVMGVSISIDDFGTGYSCMSYLRDLPIASIKIDGSFVQGLGSDETNDGIVQAIITLGRSLGLVLIGECVETRQQLETLTAMQCDMIQGHYESEPLSPADATEYLISRVSRKREARHL